MTCKLALVFLLQSFLSNCLWAGQFHSTGKKKKGTKKGEVEQVLKVEDKLAVQESLSLILTSPFFTTSELVVLTFGMLKPWEVRRFFSVCPTMWNLFKEYSINIFLEADTKPSEPIQFFITDATSVLSQQVSKMYQKPEGEFYLTHRAVKICKETEFSELKEWPIVEIKSTIFDLNVTLFTKKTFVILNNSPNDTILELKKRIQSCSGIPASQQSLILFSKRLDDTVTLDFYGITHNSPVELVLGMRGD